MLDQPRSVMYNRGHTFLDGRSLWDTHLPCEMPAAPDVRWPTMSGHTPWTSQPSPPRQLPAKVRIVTDSASDILPRHAQAIGVIVVPNRIMVDGRALRDGIDITASQFYAH